jgi:UDP-N-acetylmuramate--alanine ligase
VFIDDYAHHPEELEVCIHTLKELYPDKKITGVFQPHLFSRTADHATKFAEALSKLDECILLDIYPAREEPLPGVTSEIIKDKISNTIVSIIEYEKLTEYIKEKNPVVLVTMGAGDIDRLVPQIKKVLTAIES